MTRADRCRMIALRWFRAVLGALRRVLTPPLIVALLGAGILICLTLLVTAQRGA